MNKKLICGDIGGTKTILQLVEITDGNGRERLIQRYHSADFTSFSEILKDFLNRTGISNRPHAACFAVAGPIADQQVRLTNLSWQFSSESLSSEFSIPVVKLLNDFEAIAMAIEHVPSSDLLTIQAGQAHPQAMRVVLGAGTGMGVAWLAWLHGRYHALPTEAGHIDFAPVDSLQIQLLEALHHRLGHVSVERLLSGPGLTNIFRFLQQNDIDNFHPAPIELEDDSGAAITALALMQHHPVAIQSLELFAEIYGAYAGNLALAGLCRGGVYLAGGIAPKIADVLCSGGFIKAFCAKGRFSALLREIPVHIVTNPQVGLLGAQQEAQRLLNQ
ncbi:glucokinase [Nitrosomonas sp. wSCUT-2]